MQKIDTTAGRAQARDGTEIAYTLYRNAGSDQRSVLVHSLAMDQNFWKPVAEQLVQRASILLYDCRGHGESGKPPGQYTVGLFADDLADLLAHVGWNSALVAGASMGGAVAIQFAGVHPERTVALGLIDTTAWYGPNAPKDWEARAERALKNGLAELVEFQTTRWFSSAYVAAKPEMVRQCVQTFLRNDVQAYAQTCRMLGAFDGRKLIEGLRMPASIVVGEEDYATPRAMAEAMHGSIAGSTFAVIPAVRHLTPIECPELISGELGRLLDRAGPAQRTSP
jgi:3-oxoadipate enol-lactonase